MTPCRVTGCPGRVSDWFRHEGYPIFNGCTDAVPEEDAVFDFRVGECDQCGLVQQSSLPPLDVLYREPRAFGYGKVWTGHYDAFAEFVREAVSPHAVLLEVGGGNGVLLERLGTTADVEPNPQYTLGGVKTYRQYFDREFVPERQYDGIYASHLIEHVLDPVGFFEASYRCLGDDGVLCTACPDFSKSLESTHLNAFTPDHFNYFTPESLANVAAQAGFVVTRVEAYKDHGMYLEFRKHGVEVEFDANDTDDRWERYKETVRSMAAVIDSTPTGPGKAFLYGAHTFTITMSRYLKHPGRFDTVLDNERTKWGRRLTGTGLNTLPPEAIAGIDGPVVFVYMGAYAAEIEARLRQINPTVKVVRP